MLAYTTLIKVNTIPFFSFPKYWKDMQFPFISFFMLITTSSLLFQVFKTHTPKYIFSQPTLQFNNEYKKVKFFSHAYTVFLHVFLQDFLPIIEPKFH